MMSEKRDLSGWAERLGEARRRVEELDPETRERGARLNARDLALMAACKELRGSERTSTGAYWEETLETLEDLQQETHRALRAFNREHGIPEQ